MSLSYPGVSHMQASIDLFQCPFCTGQLVIGGGIRCQVCGHRYAIENGIPCLFVPNEWDGKSDVTEKIKAFYEETPFPNYDEIDDTGVLIDKAEKGIFAKMLDRQTPFGMRVLEVGCGTGQLSNYLGIAQRTVFGVDMCQHSLRLANDFRTKNNLDHVGFYQMNLFRPIFKQESFDLVICNGVLHHTSDPYEGFRSIMKLVKKGGYILIGLYNKYGRLVTDIRRAVFSLFGDKFTCLDPYLRRADVNAVKKRTWFMDQYKNPHESKHTIGEVLRWFDDNGLEYQSGIPSPALEPFSAMYRLFTAHGRGSWFSRGLVQLQLVRTGSEEGGFFILIGKRK